MKLYTEEQVKEAIKLARECDSDCWGVDFHNGNTNEIIEELTPIELPSDEEIEDKSIQKCFIESPYIQDVCEHYFEAGAKWMKEQIFNQNK